MDFGRCWNQKEIFKLKIVTNRAQLEIHLSHLHKYLVHTIVITLFPPW